MVPEGSPARSLVPKLVLQSKLLIRRVGASCNQPAVTLATGRVKVAHEDVLSHFVRNGLTTEGLQGQTLRSVWPCDLRVQQVLLLQGAERELREGLALVGDDAPIGARLVSQSACRKACQTLQTPRLREAHPELILATVDCTTDGLKIWDGLLLLHGGELLQRAVYEHKDGIDGFLSSAAMPQLLDGPPQPRRLGPATEGGAQAQGPLVLQVRRVGAAEGGEILPK
mmetsp:Transcript_122222/g.356788  ORF Transcript_122222/g.356788 Transcript_122222/m.356788 type:complete len:226 (+) Transcript_122222:502-1179(+)